MMEVVCIDDDWRDDADQPEDGPEKGEAYAVVDTAMVDDIACVKIEGWPGWWFERSGFRPVEPDLAY